MDLTNSGGFTLGIAIDSTNSKIYVPSYDTWTNYSYISIVDATNQTQLQGISTSISGSPNSAVLSPDNTRLYLVTNNNTVAIFNTTTNAKIAEIPVGQGAWGIKINKQGTKVYVASTDSKTISVINTATNTVSNTISTNDPGNLAFNAGGNRLYAVGGDTVSIIDPATDTVLSSTTIGTNLGLMDVGLAPVSILSVQKAGSGTGAISGNDMNCGATCTRGYADNTNVTLTATADAGSAFTGWSGDCSGTTSSVSITMNQAKNCTATFKKLYRLTVTKTGAAGSGTVPVRGLDSWDNNIGYVDAPDGDVVVPAVFPFSSMSAGTVFGGWSGDCYEVYGTSTSSYCKVRMDGPKNVTVIVNKLELNVTKQGEGTVTSSPAGINCGTDCTESSYTAITTVTLTAQPPPIISLLNGKAIVPALIPSRP